MRNANDNLKICLITEYFYPEDSGGTPTMLSQLMRYMKDNYPDLEIDVVTSSNLYRRKGSKLPRFEDWEGIRIIRVNSPKSNRPSTLLRLLAGCMFTIGAFFKLRSAIQYDLIFVGTNPPSAPLLATWLKKRYGTPYCYLIHDLYPDIAVRLGAMGKNDRLTRSAARLQGSWLNNACSVVVLGRCMSRYLATIYDVAQERIKVIPSWSDPEAIAPMPKTTHFRSRHGLDGFLAIYAGNIGRSQQLGCVIDAAMLLRKSHPDITFVLVGKGDAWEELYARISIEGLSNVRLIPAVEPSEYPEVLASADVSIVSLAPNMEGLAVPSKSYNILSSGRPMIAVMGGTSEVGQMVKEFNCGLQVDHGNSKQLADAVVKLHNSPDLLDQMGANGRSALIENYTIEHVAEDFYRLFKTIAEQSDSLLEKKLKIQRSGVDDLWKNI